MYLSIHILLGTAQTHLCLDQNRGGRELKMDLLPSENTPAETTYEAVLRYGLAVDLL